LEWGWLLSGAKSKKIIALVDTVLMGKGYWRRDSAGTQASSLAIHSELAIDLSHNFLEYALQFTMTASPAVPSIFILVSIRREKRQARAAGLLVQCYGSLMHVFI
jgi:cytochrome oxidase assembly protein ShyY1